MKSKFLNTTLTGLLLLVTSFVGNASLISGAHSTGAGKTVNLQGLEWMSLDYTAGLSRSFIEGGFTDNYGQVWQAGEWRYATRAETGMLLNSLWGGVYDWWATDNADGAAWFIENFMGLAFDTGTGIDRVDGTQSNALWRDYDWSDFFFGKEGECSADSTDSCLGTVGWMSDYRQNLASFNVFTSVVELAHLSGEPMGWIGDNTGAEFNWTPANLTTNIDASDATLGSLLVRKASAVPEPSALAIMALGLLVLSIRRRHSV